MQKCCTFHLLLVMSNPHSHTSIRHSCNNGASLSCLLHYDPHFHDCFVLVTSSNSRMHVRNLLCGVSDPTTRSVTVQYGWRPSPDHRLYEMASGCVSSLCSYRCHHHSPGSNRLKSKDCVLISLWLWHLLFLTHRSIWQPHIPWRHGTYLTHLASPTTSLVSAIQSVLTDQFSDPFVWNSTSIVTHHPHLTGTKTRPRDVTFLARTY